MERAAIRIDLGHVTGGHGTVALSFEAPMDRSEPFVHVMAWESNSRRVGVSATFDADDLRKFKEMILKAEQYMIKVKERGGNISLPTELEP